MKWFIGFFLFFITLSLMAQRPTGSGQSKEGAGPSIVGKIYGTVLDAQTKEPLDYASVVLKRVNNDKEVNGGFSENGKFKLTDVKGGRYSVQILHLGYELKTIEDVAIVMEKPDIDLGVILLTPTGIVLDEIEVTGEASAVEQRIDRLIYNPTKDISAAGGDAADVLRRVPMLSVDLEGNVSLRGSSNLLILINNRPSGMFASSVADALKMIPAEQIKSVEVITSPSAKYDGEGTAGIINIITKEKSIEGFSGNASTSIGTRRNNANASLAYAKGRFGINASGGLRFSPIQPGFSAFYREDVLPNGQLRTLTQNGASEAVRNGFSGRLGAFYDVNGYNALSLSVNNRTRDNIRRNDLEVMLVDPSRNIAESYRRISDNVSVSSGFDMSFDYRKTFPEKDKSLTFAVQWSSDNDDNESYNEQTQTLTQPLIKDHNLNFGLNNEYTAQVDYAHPVRKGWLLETGAKYILRDINSDLIYEPFDLSAQRYVQDELRSDVFEYNQNVASAYVSSIVELNEKWSLLGGVRYENTAIAGDYRDDPTAFSNSYDNWLPNVTVARKLPNFQQIKLSYNQRIQRPSLRFVNPYVDLSDQRNISRGNPTLNPELAHQFELALNTRIKSVSFNAATYFRYTERVIESFLQVLDNGVSETVFRNIGQNQTFGINLFSSATIFKIVTLRGSINTFGYNTNGIVNGEKLSRLAFGIEGNANGSVKLPKGFYIESFWFARSPRFTIQGSNAGFAMFSIGAKKEFWDKKASIGFSAIQPWDKYRDFRSIQEGSNFYQDSNFSILFQSFNVNASYKFGESEKKRQSRKQSSIDNSDVKQDNDGQM